MTTPSRSRSALERRHSDTNPYKQYWKWGSEEDLADQNLGTAQRDMLNSQQNRKQSQYGSGYSYQRNGTGGDDEVLVISRDDSGSHRIGTSQNNNNSDSQSSSLNNSMNGGQHTGLQKTFSANRFQISADKLLPSKPKNIARSASQSSEQSSDSYAGMGIDVSTQAKYKMHYSGDSDSYSECGAPTTASSTSSGDNSTSTRTGDMNSMTMTWSQGSSQSIDASEFDTPKSAGDKLSASFSLEVSDYPEAPPEDLEMNKQMELLFQEYRKIERATLEKSSNPEEVLRGLNSTQPVGGSSSFVRPKTQKQDFSQVKSKLKDYLTSSTTPKRSNPSTPRRENQNHMQPHQRRSVTPNPTSASVHRTPVHQHTRRNLPRPPSPASSTSSSLYSHSAFTPVAHNLKPNIKAVTASSSTTAWRNAKKTSDLNSTSKRDIHDSSQFQQSASSRARTGPSTPRANTPTHQKPVIKGVTRAKPPVFRPSSAPPRRNPDTATKGSMENILDSSVNNNDSSCGGFVVQSSGAWATNVMNDQDIKSSISVPQTPIKTPVNKPVKKQNSFNKTTPGGASVMCYNSLSTSLRCRSTTCLSSPNADVTPLNITNHSKDDLMTKQKQIEMTNIILDEVNASAKARKDKRSGPKTRIPQPVSRRCKSADPYSTQLKRCDSGVDITNMSPTEGSNQGDDDKIPWVQSEGVALSPQALAQYSPFEDKNEFF